MAAVPSAAGETVAVTQQDEEEKSPVDVVAQLDDLASNSLEERQDVIGGREDRKDVIDAGEERRKDVIGGGEQRKDVIGGAEEGVDVPQPSQKADLPLVVSAIEDKVRCNHPFTWCLSTGNPCNPTH